MSAETSHGQCHLDFPAAAKELLQDSQLRQNVRHATDVITAKRASVVGEMPDWQALRGAGSAIRQNALDHLDRYLTQFEDACSRSGGQVHWAVDAAEANRIAIGLVKAHAAKEVLKIKSMTTEEIGLNDALKQVGIRAHETDLAELIIQLGKDKPSHIVVPALHKNRQQVRAIFQREIDLPDLDDRPEDLTEAARVFLREKFLRIPIAIAGIEKVIPRFRDLEVFLQTLPRSATGERMNPYNSIWTGIYPDDGPQEFHVILLDNGRSEILRDAEAQQTLKCIRCGACQNACPVYRQTGGHAYESVYAGPIGAILTPQLDHLRQSASLPYASSLCGACYEVCPVQINIPEVLIHLRGQIVRRDQATFAGKISPWNIGMQIAAAIFASGDRLALAQHLGRIGQTPFVANSGFIEHLPLQLGSWTQSRDLAPLPEQSFRQWWAEREKASENSGRPGDGGKL